jgi:hypothetical protein
MATVNKSFSAVGVSDELTVPVGQSFSVSVSGTFSGTVLLEVDRRLRGEWEPLIPNITAALSRTLVAESKGKSHAKYRMRCSARASGTIVTALADVDTDAAADRPANVLRAVDGSEVLTTTEAGATVPDGKVLTAYDAVLDSPKVSTPLGCVHAIERTFTETAGAGVYTGSVTVPAGATLLDIIVNGVALWNNAGDATLDVGDGDTADGFFAGVDLKATDLLAGESLSFALAGGKAGAFIANSQVSPRYSATARVISGVVTTTSTGGSTGRTRMTVVYHLPVAADIGAATKV